MSSELGSVASKRAVDRPLSVDLPPLGVLGANFRVGAVASGAIAAYVEDAARQHRAKLADKEVEPLLIHSTLNEGKWTFQCHAFFDGKLDPEIIRDAQVELSLDEIGLKKSLHDSLFPKLLNNAIGKLSLDAFRAIPIPPDAREEIQEKLSGLIKNEGNEETREIYNKMLKVAQQRYNKLDRLL